MIDVRMSIADDADDRDEARRTPIRHRAQAGKMTAIAISVLTTERMMRSHTRRHAY